MKWLIRKDKLTIFVVLLGGLIYRFFLLINSFNHIDSDQAITGLMALHILKNQEKPVFYYGLNYQGALDAYLTTPLISIFGQHNWILHIVPLVISLLFIFIIYQTGKFFFSYEIGIFSALYAAFPPVLLNFYGFCANAGYILVLVIGTTSLLIFHSYKITPRKWKMISELLLFAFGIWIHPVMFYYIGAIAVVWITVKIYQNNKVTKKSSQLIIISFVLSVFLFIFFSLIYFIPKINFI